MGEGAARPQRPASIIVVLLSLAGCAGGYHATTAQGAGPASSASSYTTAAPGDLTGIEGSALQRLLGAPGLVRKDYPAEVWQYRNPSCVLDIYLYPDHERLTVAHAEARAPKITGDPLSACIDQFAQSRQKTVG
ncbi:MAG TPA: hypothetical protein VGJ31_01170, partial [Dongiaceae bacterium]